MKYISSKFIVGYIVVTFIATVATAWLFVFASNDLAAKSCLNVGYAMQNQFKKIHGHYAEHVEALEPNVKVEVSKSDNAKNAAKSSGIDDSCLVRFKLKVNHASENEFEIQASLKDKVIKMNQAQIIF